MSKMKIDTQLIAMQNTINQMQISIAGYTKAMFDNFRPMFDEMSKTLDQLPDDIRDVVPKLAKRGWYFSLDMDIPFLRKIQSALNMNDMQCVDALIQERIQSQISNISSRAVKRFPNRHKIISSAIEAHSLGVYELSIPVILIQIDGMCSEEFRVKFFATSNKIPKTAELITDIARGDFTDAFLIPLKELSGITAGEKFRENYPDALNRHEILHGIDTTYPSLTNSLKVISLLDYFITIVKKKDE
jgi:hypothetical protein